MKITRFSKNFRRRANLWIPRQVKRASSSPNATEAKYLREILMLHNRASEVTYEPEAIVLTRTTRREYTADFLSVDPTGRRTYHEVKGSYHLPTHDRARLAWEISAEAHPEHEFVWAELTRKGWEIERWEEGGRRIFVHYAGESLGAWHSVAADWRRHKPRKAKR